MSDPFPTTSNNSSSSRANKSKLPLLRFFARMFHMKPGKVAPGRMLKDPEVLTSGATVSSRSSTGGSVEEGRNAGPAQDEQAYELVHATAPAATRRAVKLLHFGEMEERIAAVAEIKRLAAGDPCRKRSMADLGVVQPLVSMLDELKDDRGRLLVVEALVELANGTFRNKMQMVEAGLLPKLQNLAERNDLLTNLALAQLLCSISSLANTQFPIAPCHMLPFLIQTLSAKDAADAMKLTCLATLRNLSTKLDNIRDIVAGGAVQVLLTLSQHKKLSEGALATLGNLVLSEVGKKAIEDDPMMPEGLIEAMAWDDMPKAQELAAYLLMVVAHRSKLQRMKMADMGVVPLLIQVALLGSPIAQKRAVKMLQWFKRGGLEAKMGGHSGPQSKRYSTLSSAAVDGKDVRECRLTVKRMVKQSLDRNMEIIVRRAQASEDFASGFKSLVSTSSSKSLPY